MSYIIFMNISLTFLKRFYTEFELIRFYMQPDLAPDDWCESCSCGAESADNIGLRSPFTGNYLAPYDCCCITQLLPEFREAIERIKGFKKQINEHNNSLSLQLND